MTQEQDFHIAFALYQPNFLPPAAVVVPQKIHKNADDNGFDPNARVSFYDNGVPGVSLARVIQGTHRMNEADEVEPLSQGPEVTLRLNVCFPQVSTSARTRF